MRPSSETRRLLTIKTSIVAAGLLAVLAGAGWLVSCGGSGSSGPPSLVRFLISDPALGETDLLVTPDGGVFPAFSPRSSVRGVFTPLLDGSKIENDPTTAGGATVPRSDVAVVTWIDAPGGARVIPAMESYNPAGVLSDGRPGPSIYVQATPALPSGAMLSIAFDRAHVTSKSGDLLVGTNQVALSTDVFSAKVDLPADKISPDLPVHVVFSNLPAAGVAGAVAVGVAQAFSLVRGTQPVPIDVTPDHDDGAAVFVKPMAVAGTTVGWELGDYTLTVGVGATDVFGVALAAPVTATFSVIVVTDGGAVDGGTQDAGADDASVGDAGAGNDDAQLSDAGSIDGLPATADGGDDTSSDGSAND